MNSIEKNICDAIDIIVQKAVSEAQYDKTIQATIITCVDIETGKYKVKYQDSIFYAYSDNLDTIYADGTGVYVLVPSNDMSRIKTILGTTRKLGPNYIPPNETDSYEVNGNNCITSSDSFGLCSYRKGSYAQVLYHKDYSASQNLIQLDKTAVEQYLKESGVIICGATFRTQLNPEQQYRGNYGIIFALDFEDNSTGSTVTRYYTIDVDKITGNPYKLIYGTRQYGIFEIDNVNFQRVNYISIFTDNFPNSKPDNELEDDIFISNIELFGASRLSDDDMNSYSLSIVTPQGTYFDNTSLPSDERTLQAQLRIKGKIVDSTSNTLSFYWFIEHMGITYQSLYYNKYGGRGWKCLNDYTIIQPAEAGEEAVVDWISASYELKIKKSDVVAKETRYKCVALYNDSIISKIVVIKNLGSEYTITIESDLGDQFYFDIGFPTLTCKVNGTEHPETAYTYSWAVTDNVGSFQTMAAIPDLNQQYQTAYNNYQTLLDQIARETVPEVTNKERLEQLRQELDKYDTITRVDKNKVYKINVNTITAFSTYSCTVYYNDVYIGTASIVLKNTLEAEGVYSLVINDGSYVYKYSADGISPASSSVENPINIKALTFSVYNNLGQKIDDDIIRHAEIKWIVPTEDTLLRISSEYTPSAVDLINNTATYSNLMSFSYLIEERYDIRKQRNNIQLQVNYKGMNLVAVTDLTFTKEGEYGTNGTDYTCRIVPNAPSGVDAPMYPTITQIPSGSWSMNYPLAGSQRFFRAQLYHNEEKIFDNVVSGQSAEGLTASVTWSILKNKYGTESGQDIYDSSGLSVNATTGVFNFSGYDTGTPAHIVKVTVQYDGVTYYATMPVITVKISNNNYRVNLKEGSGFRYVVYSSDGQTPQYDNVNPFEVRTTYNVGSDQWEDITEKTSDQYALTYDWGYLGTLYKKPYWEASINLLDMNKKDIPPYQKPTKPVDSFDGYCATVAVECVVSKNNTEVARIHIPVHLYLNRFGHSEINGWDGNSVSIDEDGGIILSPQVGAGTKDENNRFTGAVMGRIKEAGKSNIEVGLFGYNAGERTFKLSAKDGSAIFGKNNGGQILIDPTQNKALIYSNNFWQKYNEDGLPENYNVTNQNSEGMLIDLSTPSIKWGSGNFSVNASGYMVAKGGGRIAGWNLTEQELFSGTEYSKRTITLDAYSNKIYSGTKGFGIDDDGNPKNIDQQGFYLNPSCLILGSKFRASADGSLEIGNGAAKGTTSKRWSINANGTDSYIKYGSEGTSNSVYIGTNSLSIGNGFRVSASDGKLELGQLNGSYKWTIKGNVSRSYISYGGDEQFHEAGSSSGNTTKVYVGTDGISLGRKFSVDNQGNLKASNVDLTGVINATSGKIGNFTLDANAITGRTNDNVYYVQMARGSQSTDTAFKVGTDTAVNFKVTMDGRLTADSATFNGDTTVNGSITSADMYNYSKISLTEGRIRGLVGATEVGYLHFHTSIGRVTGSQIASLNGLLIATPNIYVHPEYLASNTELVEFPDANFTSQEVLRVLYNVDPEIETYKENNQTKYRYTGRLNSFKVADIKITNGFITSFTRVPAGQ